MRDSKTSESKEIVFYPWKEWANLQQGYPGCRAAERQRRRIRWIEGQHLQMQEQGWRQDRMEWNRTWS